MATLLAPALASTGVDAFEQEVVDRLVRQTRVRARKVDDGASLRIYVLKLRLEAKVIADLSEIAIKADFRSHPIYDETT